MKLLLISKNPADQTFAAHIATMLKWELISLDSSKKAVEAMTAEPYGACFIDSKTQINQELESLLAESVGLFSEAIILNATFFLVNTFEETLLASPFLSNVIVRSWNDTTVAAHAAIISNVIKASTSGCIGAKDLLPQTQRISLQHSTQKEEVTQAVRGYALALGFTTRLSWLIANAVDELILNALFCAPIDDLGRYTLFNAPRATSRVLDSQAAIEIEISSDAQQLAVTVIDHYGSMEKSKLFSQATKVYEELRIRAQGSGIGLRSIVRSGCLILSCEHRVETRATALFQRTLRDQPRFIFCQQFFS